MRADIRVVFAGAVTALAAWAVVQTVGWPIKTALYPRAVGIPLFILAATETVLVLRKKNGAETEETMDVSLSKGIAPEVAARRAAVAVAWMVGFYLAIVLIGLPRAVPLFVFAYLKGQSKESWTVSLILPLAAWLVFYLLFVRLLHLPFGEGLLWSRLFR